MKKLYRVTLTEEERDFLLALRHEAAFLCKIGI